MGWNQLRRVRPSVLLEGVPADAYFYFAHTYAALRRRQVPPWRCAIMPRHSSPRWSAGTSSPCSFTRRNPATTGARVLANFVAHAACKRRQRLMTLARRIIPCLDTDGERVVKGVNFVNLRDAGDPAALAARYNQEGADELVVLDIAASRDHRPTFLETIRRVAAELAIPLTAGGGVATVDEGRAILRAGADKLTVNTAALRRPHCSPNSPQNSARRPSFWRLMPSAWATAGKPSCAAATIRRAWMRSPGRKQGAACGAGEILLTSMDRDGTRSGFDLALTSAVSTAVSVPVIASGGADTPADFLAVFVEGRADAALAASIFHDAIQGLSELKRFSRCQRRPGAPQPE